MSALPSEYQLLLITLQDNGTVRVLNTALVGPQAIDIVGTATPVDTSYGAAGAFVVSFPGTPDAECPGPNYIVQGTFSPCLQREDQIC